MEKRKQIIRSLMLFLLITTTIGVLGRSDQASAQFSPFTDVGAKFVVYPDGRVGLGGTAEWTGIGNTGTSASGYLNLTGNGGTTQASAGFTYDLPSYYASQFPFNSSTADLQATYSNGLLNLGIDASSVLPQYAGMQFPFNATNGGLTATYSNGILAVEINGDSTIPPLPSDSPESQMPIALALETADATVVGNYAPGTLDGYVIFSVIDGFPFDDAKVDFTGTGTDFALNGNLTIVFGLPTGNPIVGNETELINAITQLESTVPSQIYNMTGGYLTVTSLDIEYDPITTPLGPGANIRFDIHVQGDFVDALTYLMTQGTEPDLLSSVIDQLYSSSQSGTFLLEYKHDTRKVTLSFTFSFDVQSFMDFLLTVPSGTRAYVVFSYSMQPVLLAGDIVFVEPVADPSTVVATSAGDLIAFYNPSQSYTPLYMRDVILHRAINRVFWNGTWYFQTKGDGNSSPDSWSGPDTYNGMVSSRLLIGKAFRRIPFLGYLLLPFMSQYQYYYSSYLRGTYIPVEVWKAGFSSVQTASLQISYSSINRQLDFSLNVVDKLKALCDYIVQMLPQIWPPEIPDSLKEVVQKLLSTTYASVDSAQVTLSYANHKADLTAEATISDDLNAEFNYMKGLILEFMLFATTSSQPIPWQAEFINQTEIDADNLKLDAALTYDALESSLQGLVVKPPTDPISPTQFRLQRFFNLTAPQYSYMTEFPGKNQRLGITIEGGTNATHKVTIQRPSIVPEPDVAEPNGKYMIWNNQTLSSLKDLVFEIEPRVTGRLTVKTTPIEGEVIVNGTSWGLTSGPEREISDLVDVGKHNVSFGIVTGYHTPASQIVEVFEDDETIVTGEYAEITISFNVEPSSVTLGSDITISGTITPKEAGIDVTIYYRVNGGAWKTLATVQTDDEGNYSYTWKASEAGELEFKATWKDEDNPAIESSLKTVDVTQPTDDGGSWALPTEILYLAAGVAVAIVIAIVALFLRKRK